MAKGAIERELIIEGGKVRAVSFGEGAKNLVILEGLSLRPFEAGAAALSNAYRVFAKDYTVTVFDRKNPLPQPCTMESLARDLNFAMEAAGIEQADLLGISHGGMLAQSFALEYPEKVHKAVFAFTLSRPNETAREAIGEWIKLAKKHDFEALARDFVLRLYSPRRAERYAALLPRIIKAGEWIEADRFIALAESCLTADTYGRLSAIKAPCFVIGAMNDRVVSAQASVEMAQKLTCPLYLYESLGHGASEEAKDLSLRVLQFLTE